MQGAVANVRSVGHFRNGTQRVSFGGDHHRTQQTPFPHGEAPEHATAGARLCVDYLNANENRRGFWELQRSNITLDDVDRDLEKGWFRRGMTPPFAVFADENAPCRPLRALAEAAGRRLALQLRRVPGSAQRAAREAPRPKDCRASHTR